MEPVFTQPRNSLPQPRGSGSSRDPPRHHLVGPGFRERHRRGTDLLFISPFGISHRRSGAYTIDDTLTGWNYSQHRNCSSTFSDPCEPAGGFPSGKKGSEKIEKKKGDRNFIIFSSRSHEKAFILLFMNFFRNSYPYSRSSQNSPSALTEKSSRA